MTPLSVVTISHEIQERKRERETARQADTLRRKETRPRIPQKTQSSTHTQLPFSQVSYSHDTIKCCNHITRDTSKKEREREREGGRDRETQRNETTHPAKNTEQYSHTITLRAS